MQYSITQLGVSQVHYGKSKVSGMREEITPTFQQNAESGSISMVLNSPLMR